MPSFLQRLTAKIRHSVGIASSGVRRLCLRVRGIEVGAGAIVRRGVDVGHGGLPVPRISVVLRPECQLSQGVVLHTFGGSIEIGRNVFVGPYVVMFGHGGIVIGDDTLIAMHCRILSSNHGIPPMGEHIRWQPDEVLPTRIGRDVWLGAGVTVLGGVTIGDGCVVGAGAVVSRDLPPGAIAYGVPAKVTGFRAPAAS